MLAVKEMFVVMKVIFNRAWSGAVGIHPLIEIDLNLREQQRKTEEENPRKGRT